MSSKDSLKAKHNKLVSKLYDPSMSYDMAQAAINQCDSQQISDWKNHPATLALKMSLTGDLSSIVHAVLTGGYNVEHSVDATAQRVAEAQGKAYAIQDVITYIDEMKPREAGNE